MRAIHKQGTGGYHLTQSHATPPRTPDEATSLAASALDSNTGLKRLKKQHENDPEDVFGGHASGKCSVVNLNLFVSCHQHNCPQFFAYLPSSGEVIPRENLSATDKAKAEYTIKLLNLNRPFLQTRCRQWAQELQHLFDEHVAKGWSLNHLAQIDLLPVNGKLNRFFSLTRQFYGPLAEQTLHNHAPQLL